MVRLMSLACVMLCAACHPVPSVDLSDEAGAVPTDGGFGWVSLDELPSSHTREPAGGMPSDGWASPLACAAVSSPAYCPTCWSWDDGGPWSLGRNEASDRFGAALAAGDFNGDGYPDLAVGAPGEDDQATDVGAVYVFLGSEHGYQPWRSIVANDLDLEATTGLELGSGLASLDLDHDGYDDLIIAMGAPSPSKEGRIAFLRGDPGGLADPFVMGLSVLDPSGSTESIVLGHQMAVGDFDGDGDDELAIGAPAYDMPGQPDAGAVFLVDSAGYEPLPLGRLDLDAPGIGASDGDLFGSALAVFRRYAGLSDELYVGAPGRAQVFRYDGGYDGPWSSSIGLPGFGRRLAAGDLLANGVAEVVVGGDEPEVLEVMDHGDLIARPDPRKSVEFIPLVIADVDGDGVEDLITVSVPHEETGAFDNAVYYMPGNGTTAPEPAQELELPDRETWDDLGRAGLVGDFDGDWEPELILGAPVQDSTGWGTVYALMDGKATDWVNGEPKRVDQETALDCDICAVHEWGDGTICDGGSGAQICVDESCVVRRCGDGYRQTAADPWPRESCDDGNNLDGDLCSASCVATGYTLGTTPDGRHRPYGPRYTAGVDGAGAILVVWSAPSMGGDLQLQGQRFSRRGVPVGTPLALADPQPLGIDVTPSVAGLGSGGWVVTWSEPGGDDSMAGVLYRLVEADGALGAPRAAASEPYLDQLAPSVAALSSGFVVAWVDTSRSITTGPARRVVARRFYESGNPNGDEFGVSAEPEREHAEPALAASADTFLVAWVDRGGPETDPTEVRGRRFDPSGAVDAADLVLAGSRASEVALATLDTGDFVAVWRDGGTDAWGDIVGRRVAASGSALDEPAETLAGSAGSSPFTAQFAPSVAALPGGHYAVVYAMYRADRGLELARSSGAVEPADWSSLGGLVADIGGDGSLLATPRGLLAVWSDDSIAGAWRSTFAYLLAVD